VRGQLADLAREHIGTIIWATGYAYDLGWVMAAVLDNAGRPARYHPHARLYFLGLHWMHTIKSGLLSGAGNDAEYLAEHIAGTD
jgi:putative flavoprotein involved in K+ transport